MERTSICDRYYDLRTEKGLTIRQLADAIKCNEKTISFYENGTREMPRNVLLKYAEYFNVTTDWLLGLSENRHYDNANIGDRTGLSDKAIDILEDFKERNFTDTVEAINYLLAQEEMSPKDEYPEYFCGEIEIPKNLLEAQKKWEEKQLTPLLSVLWDYIRTANSPDDFAIDALGNIQKLDKTKGFFSRLTNVSLDGLREIKGNAIIEQVLLSEICEKLKKTHNKYIADLQQQSENDKG